MAKGIVHTRVVSTSLIVICIVVSAALAGYFTNIYKTCNASRNEPPVASAGESPLFSYPGAALTFDGSESYDPDGDIISYDWHFDEEEFEGMEKVVRLDSLGDLLGYL
jgi:hypothetical protein